MTDLFNDGLSATVIDFGDDPKKKELFRQLCALTRNWNDHEDIPRSQQLECRKIGEALSAIGGNAAMVEAYYIARALNSNVHVIQAYWDGVGDFQW
jgi:hypothetical protein